MTSCSDAEGKAKKPGEALSAVPTEEPTVAAAQAELPADLERLAQIFARLCTICILLVRNDVIPTFSVLQPMLARHELRGDCESEADGSDSSVALSLVHLQRISSVVPHLLRLQEHLDDASAAAADVLIDLDPPISASDSRPASASPCKRQWQSALRAKTLGGARRAIDMRVAALRTALADWWKSASLLSPLPEIELAGVIPQFMVQTEPHSGEITTSYTDWCRQRDSVSADNMLEHLRSLPTYLGQIAHTEDLPGRSACYATPSFILAPAVQTALVSAHIERLYSHQATAIDRLMLEGKHVAIATSTSSGKSLCYTLPSLHLLACNTATESPTMLFLFPTKALAQDQLRGLAKLAAAGGIRCMRAFVFDGDTPMNLRPAIRAEANVIISNPDMVHATMLPEHRDWARFWRNLRIIAVDECHVYRGVFGSHVALVLRRLTRVCESYAASPRWVVSSATILNLPQHVNDLTGSTDLLQWAFITADGSPCGRKLFAMWNPPVIHPPAPLCTLCDERHKAEHCPVLVGSACAPEEAVPTSHEKRKSSIYEFAQLLCELVRHGLRTIAFANSRKVLFGLYVHVRICACACAQASGI